MPGWSARYITLLFLPRGNQRTALPAGDHGLTRGSPRPLPRPGARNVWSSSSKSSKGNSQPTHETHPFLDLPGLHLRPQTTASKSRGRTCETRRSRPRPLKARTPGRKPGFLTADVWERRCFHALPSLLGNHRKPTGLQLAPRQLEGLLSRRFWGALGHPQWTQPRAGGRKVGPARGSCAARGPGSTRPGLPRPTGTREAPAP